MKIGEIYNLNSFERFCDSASQTGFKDSQAGVVLARNLTAIDPTLFEKKYPELALVNSGIEVSNIGGYASVIQSLRILDKGDFTLTKDKDGNKGKISLSAEDSTIKVFPHAAHSEWSDDEVKEADLQGINLPSQFVATHNRLYLRKLDEIGLVGLGAGAVSTGLLNSTAFAALPAGGTIETRTAQQAYDEIATLLNTQFNSVNNAPEYKANRVIMPTRVMNRLQSVILNTAASADTVLAALQKNYPSVMFLASFRGDTTGNGGNLATSATVCYSNNSEAMKLRVPVPLEIGEIIKPASFQFRVDSKFRIAGLDVLETTAGYRLTGL